MSAGWIYSGRLIRIVSRVESVGAWSAKKQVARQGDRIICVGGKRMIAIEWRAKISVIPSPHLCSE
jgi:hypothetical protein